jgi:hypothetical protein
LHGLFEQSWHEQDVRRGLIGNNMMALSHRFTPVLILNYTAVFLAFLLRFHEHLTKILAKCRIP